MKPDPVGKHWEDCRWVLGHTRTFTPAAREVIERSRQDLCAGIPYPGGGGACRRLGSHEFCLPCYSHIVEQLVDSCAECKGQPLYHRCGSCAQQILTKAHGFCETCAETMALLLAGTGGTVGSPWYVAGPRWDGSMPQQAPCVMGRAAVPCKDCLTRYGHPGRPFNEKWYPNMWGSSPEADEDEEDEEDEEDDRDDEWHTVEKTVPFLPEAARQTLSYYMPLFRSAAMIRLIHGHSWALCAACRYANCETLCQPCLNVIYSKFFTVHPECTDKPLGDRCASCMYQLLADAHGFCGDCASRLTAHVTDGQPLSSRDHMFPCETCWTSRPDAIELVIGDQQAVGSANYPLKGVLHPHTASDILEVVAQSTPEWMVESIFGAPMYITTQHPPQPAHWSPAIRIVHTQEDGRGYAIEFTDGDDHFRVTSFSRVQYVEQLNGQDALGHPQWLAVQEGVELLLAKAALYAATSQLHESHSPIDELAETGSINPKSFGAPTLSGLAKAYGATLLGGKD